MTQWSRAGLVLVLSALAGCATVGDVAEVRALVQRQGEETARAIEALDADALRFATARNVERFRDIEQRIEDRPANAAGSVVNGHGVDLLLGLAIAAQGLWRNHTRRVLLRQIESERGEGDLAGLVEDREPHRRRGARA